MYARKNVPMFVQLQKRAKLAAPIFAFQKLIMGKDHFIFPMM